jgi:arylsulfatase A-like enzyme
VHRTIARAAAWLLSLLAAGCAPECTPVTAAPGPNVVLVTVDTLRADHVGSYGNPTVRTPAIDRLASEGTVFERCYAQTHVTVPSHLTIFSSLPLADHGVSSNAGRSDRTIEVVTGAFERAGYRTAAVVSAKHLGPQYALGTVLQSLELHDAPERASVPYPAEETTRRAVRWIRDACRDPFFVWVHYWDPHAPYVPPEPFRSEYYKADPYDPAHDGMNQVILGWHFYDLDGLRGVLAPHQGEIGALEAELGIPWRELRRLILYQQDLDRYTDDPAEEENVRRRLGALAAFARARLPLGYLGAWLKDVRDLRFPLAQYAGEVSYVDTAIGQLRAELERLDLAGRTILVLTADHGESLGEHGIFFDHAALYDPHLRVPLIIWAPGRVEATRRSEPVRALDLAPTILRLADLPVPAAMQGRDLFDENGSSLPVVAESNLSRQVMIFDGRWKLIRTLATFDYGGSFRRDAGTLELYDLADDPREESNQIEARADVARSLGERLDAWLVARRPAADGEPRPGPLDARSQEQLEALEALGYVE